MQISRFSVLGSRFSVLVILALCVKSSAAFAQTNWTIDSVAAFIDTLTLPDSSYLHDHLIIRFQPGVLDEGALCYTYWSPYDAKKGNSDFPLLDSVYLSDSERFYLMAQKFPLNSGILADSSVLASLQAAGGSYLMRLTWFNPCVDTISITRNGDTLHCNWFNLMYLYLDSGVDALPAEKSLIIASLFDDTGRKFTPYPDLIGRLLGTPSDPNFSAQHSLSSDDIGVETAWDYSVCSPSTRVAIIDDGLDYRRCEFNEPFTLSSAYGKGHKVEWGYDYPGNDDLFDLGSSHGTPVAAIAGCLTNNTPFHCKDEDGTPVTFGVAGIAGGWNTSQWLPGNFGCTLLGYQISFSDESSITTGYALSALLDASTWNPADGVGGRANVINCSWGFPAVDADYKPLYGNILQNGVDWAYSNGSLVVFGRGQYDLDYNWQVVGGDRGEQPQESEPDQSILSVGAHEYNNAPVAYWSERDLGMDIIAPSNPANGSGWIYTTQLGTDVPSGSFGSYSKDALHGTSFAAPHATGVAALLVDWFANQPLPFTPTPEDLQNIMKVCTKRPAGVDVSYDPDYVDPKLGLQHEKWGWGL